MRRESIVETEAPGEMEEQLIQSSADRDGQMQTKASVRVYSGPYDAELSGDGLFLSGLVQVDLNMTLIPKAREMRIVGSL